ncbi:MAG: hypothetical protein Ct9H300mP28_30750 [Pseudomonadota bacterium]|nr:MAG: hypothetical protein Ct9H300mP28_30750 [Pseudomonadota bacterium]
MAESSAWVVFISAIFATYIWRFAGVMISHRLKPTIRSLSGLAAWPMV